MTHGNGIPVAFAHPLAPLEHPWIHLAEQLQQPPCRRRDRLVPTLPILDQVAQEVLLHCPRLSSAHFSDRVQTRCDDLAAHTRMYELLRELPHDRRQRIGRGVLVRGLREGDEDGRNAELMVREVFNDVCVEAKHAKIVPAHDAREELHQEDFVVKGETLVVALEKVVQLLAEGLWIM